MTTPTTTARRKKPLKPTKDKTQAKPVLDVEAVEVVPEASTDDGAHLTDFVVPEIDDDAEDVDAPIHIKAIAEQAAAQVDQVSKEAFFAVFKTPFEIPQHFQPDMAPLAVQPDEERGARAASDATYELLKIYYPAALSPKGEVFAHLMAVGPFLIAKVMIVREVLRARRAKPANPPERPPEPPTQPPPAANDNFPPNVVAVDFSRQSEAASGMTAA